MSVKLFVGGLAWETNDDALKDAFSAHGDCDAQVVVDRNTGRSRGFGFVTFQNEGDAFAARDAWNGKELDGREIRVDVASERSEGDRPRGRGGFRGGDGGGFGGGGRGGGGGGGGYRGGRGGGGGYGGDRGDGGYGGGGRGGGGYRGGGGGGRGGGGYGDRGGYRDNGFRGGRGRGPYESRGSPRGGYRADSGDE